MLAYLREADGQAALVVLEFAGRSTPVRLPPSPSGRPWAVALSTHPEAGGPDADGRRVLRALEALVLVDG